MVPLNWLARAKVRIVPIDDSVTKDEQGTIDLYFRWGPTKRKLVAADIVDRSFSDAFAEGAGCEPTAAHAGLSAGSLFGSNPLPVM